MRIFRNAMRSSSVWRARNWQIYRLYEAGCAFLGYPSPYGRQGMNPWLVNVREWDYPPWTPEGVEYPTRGQERHAWRYINSLVFPRQIHFFIPPQTTIGYDLRHDFILHLGRLLGHKAKGSWALYADLIDVIVTDEPYFLFDPKHRPPIEDRGEIDAPTDHLGLEPEEQWEERVTGILYPGWRDDFARARAEEMMRRLPEDLARGVIPGRRKRNGRERRIIVGQTPVPPEIEDKE